ncbi:hypothetical protein Tco_0942678 [Tanacetum coccineum]
MMGDLLDQVLEMDPCAFDGFVDPLFELEDHVSKGRVASCWKEIIKKSRYELILCRDLGGGRFVKPFCRLSLKGEVKETKMSHESTILPVCSAGRTISQKSWGENVLAIGGSPKPSEFSFGFIEGFCQLPNGATCHNDRFTKQIAQRKDRLQES